MSRLLLILMLMLPVVEADSGRAQCRTQHRTIININRGWAFSMQTHTTGKARLASVGAERARLESAPTGRALPADSSHALPATQERMVDLPHDFQIEQPWVAPAADEQPDMSDGAANVRSRLSARGFKEMGTGRYRKTIVPETAWQGRRVVLDIEGIMLVGDVFLNGEHIGGTDYGYLGFDIDITDRLRYGQENELLVTADTGEPDNSRWFTGGGLYRDVNIILTDSLRFLTRHPLYIRTDTTGTVVIQAEATCRDTPDRIAFRVTITDAAGSVVYSDVRRLPFNRRQRTREYVIDTVTIDHAQLWSCETPYLYTAHVELLRDDGTVADDVAERFGIRTIEYSPDFGLRLNGRKVLLKGIAGHHTSGALGAAAFPRAMEKSIQLLKDFGFNHIRTSHNPYSRAFLDLCDEYGMLVVDELYDKWLTKYAGGRRPWTDMWQHDIPEFIRRDRNHPSVVMWSLGNELQTYWSLPYADWGVTAYRLQHTLLQRYDDTRPVTVAMHPRGRSLTTDSLPAPLALETDIAAYNYRYTYFAGDGRRFPDMVFYQSEASTEAMGPNYWDMDLERVVGLAYWGAIDYLGESAGWPAKGWANGVFDISLEPKPQAYFLRSIFKEDEPVVHIGIVEAGAGADSCRVQGDRTQWNGITVGTTSMYDRWDIGADTCRALPAGRRLTLYTFTNADEVELTVNGRSLGRRTNDRADSRRRNRIRWDNVDYEAGYVEAIAYNNSCEVARHRLETTGRAVALRAEGDNSHWLADGSDLQHVRVTAVDSEGRHVRTATDRLTFAVSGPATIAGVINGDINSDEPMTGNERSLYNGTATVILRSTPEAGEVTLTVTADSLTTACLRMTVGADSCRAYNSPCTDWPAISGTMKPGTRWWWPGSAVDTTTLTTLMEDYAAKGIGALEITPVYGVQGNEDNELSFLSPQWMTALRHTMSEGRRLGIEIDMNNGTGWPFGGPGVTIDDAACRLLFDLDDARAGADSYRDRQQSIATIERRIARDDGDTLSVYCGKTLQKVKRAAPGGEGWVLNHFDRGAVARYLDTFANAFDTTATPYPACFFNDSYEVYNADYTPGLFDEFLRRRGYRLEDYMAALSADCTEWQVTPTREDTLRRVVSDYRETMAELLEESLTQQWTDWAHSHGSMTRNQAHGSPGNLVDLYAAVDIPECESFGITDFGIDGLRTDSLTIPNYSDLSMLKYASSGAHIAGHRYTSSETLTWLTEHFRTSLSQCKPETDLMFSAGVNRVFFHGTAYSPPDEPWPGWKFYAAMDMSPTNPQWRDAEAFFRYIARCQSFVQAGEPDNDLLLYVPVYDMWHDIDWTARTRLVMFDIHKMAQRAPRFIGTVETLYSAGYDMDYVSDRFVRSLHVEGQQIVTDGGTHYKALVVPGVRRMPLDVLQRLLVLARQGATIVFTGSMPQDMPGLMVTDRQRTTFSLTTDSLAALPSVTVTGDGEGAERSLQAAGIRAEGMRSVFGLHSIRRKNACGRHYFISALKGGDTEAWIPLAVDARSAMLFDPMTGDKGKARLRTGDDGTEVYLQLASGQSLILVTYDNTDIDAAPWPYLAATGDTIALDGLWDIAFTEATPAVSGLPQRARLGSWTELDATGVDETMGTMRYTTTFDMSGNTASDDDEWLLDLGDVRESARVTVNGHAADTLFAVPYRCRIGRYLRPGTNTIEVEVTNLPANRIAAMDRQGIAWRRFKDANIVNIHYDHNDYSQWQPMPSGLLGPVNIIRMKRQQL